MAKYTLNLGTIKGVRASEMTVSCLNTKFAYLEKVTGIKFGRTISGNDDTEAHYTIVADFNKRPPSGELNLTLAERRRHSGESS